MSRLWVLPLVLLAGVSGATFGLAKWHPAKPGLPTSAGGGSVTLGDQYRGETIFSQSCAGCHGAGGKGGVGPRIAGAVYPIALVKAQIDRGGGTMPAGLVKGRDEADVLAYVASITASR